MEDPLDGQGQHWESTFSRKPDMFGAEASAPAWAAVELFKRSGVASILELGGGQGRDTLFFARSGFSIRTLDYSESAVASITDKAAELGLTGAVKTLRHDIRERLPFEDGTFDACYSHMLFCMALTRQQLESLASEVRRVLRPGGLHVYTVRTTEDAHYQTGIHRGENMYEVDGFIVHFFSREMVDHLAKGYEILSVENFDEGKLPRKLYRVTLRAKE